MGGIGPSGLGRAGTGRSPGTAGGGGVGGAGCSPGSAGGGVVHVSMPAFVPVRPWPASFGGTMCARPAGMLLTGGASRRMGFDKAMIDVGGVPNALRLAGALGQVAGPLVEVGPGRSGLPAVSEEPPGAGPLVALCAGWDALVACGCAGPVLVVACDLAFLTAEALAVLSGWPGVSSALPVVGGRPQPLCARWSQADMEVARELVVAGERSMKALLARAAVEMLSEVVWPGDPRRVFADVDTPQDLRRFGLACPGAPGRQSAERTG